MREHLYSFYEQKKYDKDEMLKILEEKNFDKYEYTYGLEYRSPTTNHVPITKEQAIGYLKEGGFIDVELIDGNTIHINEVSANDMW